jgi:hypothetical protein
MKKDGRNGCLIESLLERLAEVCVLSRPGESVGPKTRRTFPLQDHEINDLRPFKYWLTAPKLNLT